MHGINALISLVNRLDDGIKNPPTSSLNDGGGVMRAFEKLSRAPLFQPDARVATNDGQLSADELEQVLQGDGIELRDHEEDRIHIGTPHLMTYNSPDLKAQYLSDLIVTMKAMRALVWPVFQSIKEALRTGKASFDQDLREKFEALTNSLEIRLNPNQ